MHDLIQHIAADHAFQAMARALEQGRRVVATGIAGSSAAFAAAALVHASRRPVVMIVAHLDDADEALDELHAATVPVLRLPAMESLPGEGGGGLDVLAERLGVLRAIIANADQPGVLVCPIQALMQAVPAPGRLDELTRTLRRGETVNTGQLVRWLEAAGFARVDGLEEPGEFTVRGGIIDIFSPGGLEAGAEGGAGVPVRLDFFGDEIEKITEVDLETLGSGRALESVELVCADPKTVERLAAEGASCNVLELVSPRALVMLVETMELIEQARGYFERVLDARGVFGPPAVLALAQERFHALAELNQYSAGAAGADERVELPVARLPAFATDTAQALDELRALGSGGARVIVCCQNQGELHRFQELNAPGGTPQASQDGAMPGQAGLAGLVGQTGLAQAGSASSALAPIDARVAYVHRGFVWQPPPVPASGARDPAGAFAIVPYHEFLNRFTTRRRGGRLRGGRTLDTFLDFQAGDYVVHQEHGIAVFTGLHLMTPRALPGRPASTEPEEYLTLEFAGRSRLQVPATQIDLVQRYVGGFSGKPPLSTLGGQRWKGQKARTMESVKDLASEMLRVRAAREQLPGIRYPDDTAWQREFEDEFPYEETEDQVAAMSAIKKDMGSPRPMDRLICGDVGFGKTELAIRAAFKAVEFGKQVAVLVPTTVLAEQHERTFRSRFAGYPFRIESLSRFKTAAEQTRLLADVRRGAVDVVVGTHRIISEDVRFADLGLVVIDEEQRFGVEHKERLLRLRLTVDVLTLSATPIPRTLHMAMLGLRDISSLTTPPLDRRAVVSEVLPYNERRIAQAIARELAREGQVYFVHNRVHDIMSVADDVRRLAPDAKIIVGHGQMPAPELEQVMLTFMRGPAKDSGADILVSTTIIESGIDIPSANTIIIKDADRFGLADLHQLRGRVGRSKHRAYCYFLLPPDRPVTDVAQKRLRAIEQYSMLGAGFKIAMRDLEIRGAGNILGAEQSGHIAAVGYDMYCRLLEQAVGELRTPGSSAASVRTSIEIGVCGHIPRSYIPSDARRLEAYRRLATASSSADLERLHADLRAAYGDPPRPLRRMLELAEVRIGLVAAGVRTLTIREKDVVFLSSTPQRVADALSAPPQRVKATVRVLPGATPNDLAEVFYRPPEAYLAPDTLLAILRARFGAAPAAGAGGPAPELSGRRAVPARTAPGPGGGGAGPAAREPDTGRQSGRRARDSARGEQDPQGFEG